MTVDEIEDLIRRYLSTGIAVVLIVFAPGTGATDPAPRDAPAATSATPTPEPAPGRDTTPPATADAEPAAAPVTWGAPAQEDDFSSGLAQWELYDGPGHAGRGMRSPSAATVEGGVLTLTGDADGTTAGMCWPSGQRYGRWEARVRAPASDPTYDAVVLLWPDSGDPADGEIDLVEMQDPTRQRAAFFLHHGDGPPVTGEVEIDATQWHDWAVEWTPEAITAFVDGEQWFRTTDTAAFPPGPMHLCVQLDWFPEGSGDVQESTMQVDRVARYVLPG